MVTKETVSSIQMAALLLLYTTGSTIIFIPSSLLPESGNAAWIAWIIAGLFGSLVLSCMLYLCNKHPGDTLVEIGFHAIGRPFTTILLVPFVLFMLLLSAYIYFSVGSFFNTSMMRETPLPVFNGLMALISALTARAGILIMARMFRIINIILVGVIIVVLLLNLENYHPSFLLPILPNGIKPVFHSVYQVGGFIYGDFLVFAVIFGYMLTKKGKTGNKQIAAAFAINWLLLTMVSLCVIMALGPMTNDYAYPLFTLSRLIRIQELIERFESIIGMGLIAGSYMKATLTLFALNATLTRLLKIKDENLLIFPLALLGLVFSLVIVKNESVYGEVLLTWPLVTFTASLPVYLLTLITLFKKRST